MGAKSNFILFLQKDVEQFRQAASIFKTSYVLRAVGEKWGLFFMPDLYASPLRTSILEEASKRIPIVLVSHHENYGWIYMFYHEGRLIGEGGGDPFEKVFLDEAYGFSQEEVLLIVEQNNSLRHLATFRFFDITNAEFQLLDRATAIYMSEGGIVERFTDAGDIFSILGLEEAWGWQYETLQAMGLSSNL